MTSPKRAVASVALPTLPDLLAPGLHLVFVGINPSVYSAERGHYFARPGNRFWPCFSRSILSEHAREELKTHTLGPEHDRAMLHYGIGFTDVVKRPTSKASEVSPAELATGVETLTEKMARYQPRVACFHGITGYRPVHDVLVGRSHPIALGLQDVQLGTTRLFLVPNPSGANAHFTRSDQIRWYDELATCVAQFPWASGTKEQ